MNLIYAGQAGAVPSSDVVSGTSYPFAKFDSYSDGYQAALNQVALDASRGETISQFTAKIASSPSDNPTLYASNMAAAVGLSPDDLLASAGAAGASDPSLSDALSLDMSSGAVPDWTTYIVGGLLLALGVSLVTQ